MKAILASLGTVGDFEPMLALAVGMKRRGHHPVLANSPDYADRAALQGIPFVPIGPPVSELGLNRCLQEILEVGDPVDEAKAMVGCIVPFVPRMVGELEDACSAADVLVCLPYQLAGLMTHERTGIPYIAWSFSPFGATPSGRLAQATSSLINEARQTVGLEGLPDPLGAAISSSRAALFATSGYVFRRPRSWPSHYHLTGCFFLDEEDWQPDSRLVEFMEMGPRPIVVTFGSMRHPNPRAVTDILFDAIEQLGCRAIVQRGWSGLGEGRHATNVHVATKFIPHRWLFKHASCIVHHGAAGTAAAALRAGVRSVIVPHALDQALWAQLMCGCGAAAAAIPFPGLRVDRLVAAVRAAWSADGDERLQRLSAKVCDEGGIERAVSLIEQEIGETKP